MKVCLCFIFLESDGKLDDFTMLGLVSTLIRNFVGILLFMHLRVIH